ncbi:unnamed protein product [Fusarium graminearum]|uniref:Phytanoyl-CoA dioxygenase n=1 Tax=Gibberella zeae TaxID=5518 RepID=A0A4E9D573_GIBZA|nr:unnamed protein product [Fusarium graminearum]CAG1976485.1 unnamed protein product [Fusarium graminearum]CAG2014221.1 unnamed protein product [Fusarium graminearum]
MPTSQYLQDLDRDGFVVIKSIVDSDKLEALRGVSSKATQLARDGQWPFVRTVPKQFPPWDASQAREHGIWGVQHLMNPELPGHELFTELYFSETILGIVKQLLQCQDEHLVMELFNMLVRPEKDFELRWHRDDIPAEASQEEEMERLGKHAYHAQYNFALWEDESLIVVPGSHKRARTSTERDADPFAKSLPNQLIVKLEPGDIVFYNNNILHRGAYDNSKERMTLHGSVGHIQGNSLRARNVLQHGVGSWVDKCDFQPLLEDDRRRAEEMRQRLIRLGSESGQAEPNYCRSRARQCRGCSYGRPNSQGIASFADASQAGRPGVCRSFNLIKSTNDTAYRSSELSTNLLPLDSVTSRRKEKKGGLGLHGL